MQYGAPTREQELLRQQDVLAKFGELAIKCSDLGEILNEACRLVGEALGTELAKVMELQEDGITLLVRAGVGWKPGVVGEVRVRAERESSEGYALQTGKPVASADIDQETRFTYAGFLKDNGVKALTNVPIFGSEGRRPYGILEVDSRSPREFTDGNINFLRTYANLLAAAVERLHLIQEARNTEHALRQWNESLEDRVAERTSALTREQKERQIAEEKLRQSQKMEAVGQLTGGLAHDFNNLLAGIVGSLDLIQVRVRQGRTSELERYITAAMTSASRAAALTHRLLAFSRRQTLDPKVIETNALISDMEDLLRRTLGPSVVLETRLPAGLGAVLCDPNQLENALLNLVINARDAMPDGGNLIIESRLADVEGVFASERDIAPGSYVLIAVTDSGTGMLPEVIERAFDPFFTTKPLGEGTGLGLSMIYGFAKQSGGQVRIHSKQGMGTTVTLFLPKHDGELSRSTAIAARGEMRAGAGDSVLVVDDEAVIRMLIVEVLQDLGYSAVEAVDGISGLRQIERNPRFDLLVTDVGLPGGMNGRQLADAARQRQPDLKVLFITGFAETIATEKGVLEPGMEVLTKPFTMDAIATRIRAMINPS